jgi:hypothetical protein
LRIAGQDQRANRAARQPGPGFSDDERPDWLIDSISKELIDQLQLK